MKLSEKLKEYKGQQIKIGSKISYIYCEICDDNIEDRLNILSHEMLEKLIYNKNKYERHLTNFEDLWKKRYDTAFKRLKNRSPESIRNFNNRQEQLKRDEKEHTIDRLNYYKKRIEIFTPYLSRNVIEVFKSIVYDCTIIRIEGAELGDYWDRSEFRRSKDYKEAANGVNK